MLVELSLLLWGIRVEMALLNAVGEVAHPLVHLQVERGATRGGESECIGLRAPWIELSL